MAFRAVKTGCFHEGRRRQGWRMPTRRGDGVSDKSARVESPRATGLSSDAFDLAKYESGY